MEVAYLLKTLKTRCSIISEFKIYGLFENGIKSWKYNTIVFITYNHDALTAQTKFLYQSLRNIYYYRCSINDLKLEKVINSQ